MPATVIDGKALAAATKAEAAEKVRELKSRGINPCLAVILVGGEPRQPGLRPRQDQRLCAVRHREPQHQPARRHHAGRPCWPR